jgi:hypothetical protein
MRTTSVASAFVVLMLVMLAIGAAPASAQEIDNCHPISPSESVIVTRTEGDDIKGMLLCISQREVVIAEQGQVSRYPLEHIQRIRKPRDPVWNGAAIGAAIPLIFWAVLCHECNAEPMLKASLTYGLIGLTVDALRTGPRDVYAGPGKSASFAWRIRF